MSKRFLVPLTLPTGTSNPASGNIGDLFYRSDQNQVYVYTGSGWQAASQDIAVTASRALVSDANGLPSASSVTATELGYVSGVTSAIQTQLGAKINASDGVVTTASTGSTVVRNITLSTSSPSGGTSGDVWLKYTA